MKRFINKNLFKKYFLQKSLANQARFRIVSVRRFFYFLHTKVFMTLCFWIFVLVCVELCLPFLLNFLMSNRNAFEVSLMQTFVLALLSTSLVIGLSLYVRYLQADFVNNLVARLRSQLMRTKINQPQYQSWLRGVGVARFLNLADMFGFALQNVVINFLYFFYFSLVALILAFSLNVGSWFALFWICLLGVMCLVYFYSEKYVTQMHTFKSHVYQNVFSYFLNQQLFVGRVGDEFNNYFEDLNFLDSRLRTLRQLNLEVVNQVGVLFLSACLLGVSFLEVYFEGFYVWSSVNSVFWLFGLMVFSHLVFVALRLAVYLPVLFLVIGVFFSRKMKVQKFAKDFEWKSLRVYSNRVKFEGVVYTKINIGLQKSFCVSALDGDLLWNLFSSKHIKALDNVFFELNGKSYKRKKFLENYFDRIVCFDTLDFSLVENVWSRDLMNFESLVVEMRDFNFFQDFLMTKSSKSLFFVYLNRPKLLVVSDASWQKLDVGEDLKKMSKLWNMKILIVERNG